jgi:hypothetical protein
MRVGCVKTGRALEVVENLEISRIQNKGWIVPAGRPAIRQMFFPALQRVSEAP